MYVMSVVLNDLLLFSCLTALVTGIVLGGRDTDHLTVEARL